MRPDLVIFDDLRDKVPRVAEVGHDRHPDPQDKHVRVFLQQALHHSLLRKRSKPGRAQSVLTKRASSMKTQADLCIRVVRSGEVRRVGFREALATALRETVIIVVDAARGVGRQVDPLLEAEVGQIQRAQHVRAYRLDLRTQGL